MAPVPAPEQPKPLSAEEQAAIRKAVYGQNPKTASPNMDFRSVLLVPKGVTEPYQKNPAAVIDLLTRIADGAAPSDSLVAVGYALELKDGPGMGVLPVTMFKFDTYDQIDKDWGCTPREHWLRVLKGKPKDK